MSRDDLITAFILAARAHQDVQALLLSGSLGRGEGDVWSDVDLIAVVASHAHGGFVEGLPAWVEPIAAPILWRQVYPGLPLFHAVTAQYLRYDITVATAEMVVESADRVVGLVDKAGIVPGLPATREAPPVSPAALESSVEEFLRVLGLLPVGIGRREYAAAQTGVGLLRQQLQSLMVMELGCVAPPGALSISRFLPRRDITTLERLGHVGPDAQSLIAQSLACADAFLPRARRLAAETGADWPHALETAVRRHLQRELGVAFAI